MNVPFFIARRYFWSAKKKKFINIISVISVVCLAVGTMSLVIVMSIFNGLEGLIQSLFQSFDAPLQITAASGKSFTVDDDLKSRIYKIDGVAAITEVAEDFAYVKYRDNEAVIKVKGVDQDQFSNTRLSKHLISGRPELVRDSMNYSIIGQGVQYALSIPPQEQFYALQVYYPRDIDPGAMSMNRLFNHKIILPGGVFAIEKQYDEKYIFAPLDWTLNLFGWDNQRSALELELAPEASTERVKDEVRNMLGEDFVVRDSDEQHSSLFRVVKIEKLFSFLAFSFILLIASINIFFALTMLAIDKKKDISILFAMGVTRRQVRRLFFYEGAIMSLGGSLIGVLLGCLFCFLQEKYNFLTMGTSTAVMNAYPIEVQITDILLTAASIILITLAVTIRPSRLAAGTQLNLQN